MQFLGVVGTHINSQSKESQGVRLLGRLTIPKEKRPEVLTQIKELTGVDELVYLATCNRIEFIFSADEALTAIEIRNKILDFFFRDNGSISFSPNDFYVKAGLEAGRHLFSVASAIDSLVVGEAQILGQVKEAYFDACENDLAGKQLALVFQRVFKVAKKVRTRTELGKKSVSMVSLATAHIQQVIKEEGHIPVAIIGVGPMSRKMARYLSDKGISDIVFVNRTKEKADMLAEEFSGSSMALEDFLQNPPAVRIICTSTGSPTPIFTDVTMSSFLRASKQLMIIDLAIPCDVEIKKPIENRLEIYNIDDLKKISDKNRRQRFRDVDKARAIISDEVDRYHQRIIESELKPVFDLSYQEAREYARNGLNSMFTKTLVHIDRSDKEQISRFIEKLVGYATFLPARTLANRIAESNIKQRDPEGMYRQDDEDCTRTFRKGA
ncbi:MAG: glutamyl-tRNA reductase [candidate division Zixibacteria bacterium]|nr:glutamyl-tRNA reductase [candidate division Zixibacteria bacterium]